MTPAAPLILLAAAAKLAHLFHRRYEDNVLRWKRRGRISRARQDMLKYTAPESWDMPAPTLTQVFKTVTPAKFQQSYMGLEEMYELRLHLFRRPNDTMGNQKRACVLAFHGGGWYKGIPEIVFAHCAVLAERGVIAIAPEYRILEKGTSIYDCIADAWSAVEWVLENHLSLDIDCKRIVISGHSAGGQIAACLGSGIMMPQKVKKLMSSTSADIAATVLYNPITSMTRNTFVPPTGSEEVALVDSAASTPHPVFQSVIGEDLEYISPSHNISGDLPATMIFHGTADKIVPLEQSRMYQQLLQEAGVLCELLEYEGQIHGFAYAKQDVDVPAAFMSTTREMEKFLTHLGILSSADHCSSSPWLNRIATECDKYYSTSSVLVEGNQFRQVVSIKYN